MSEQKKKNLKDLHEIYPLTVLIIDDDEEYVNELYKEAKNYYIEIKHKTSLEEAKNLFLTEEGKSIRGVILDIICMKDDKQEVPDNTFIITASRYFDRHFPDLPFVALTGDSGERERIGYYFKDDMRVFFKAKDEEEMFKYIRSKALNYEKMKIRVLYPEIFEIVDKYFSKEAEDMLFSCIRDMQSNDKKIITGTLGTLRKLQENFYIALHKIDEKLAPKEFIYKNKNIPNVQNEKIIRHLKGNYEEGKGETTDVIVPHGSYMDRLLYFLYKGCSGELHHSSQKTSKYTVQALIYGFMDMLLWLNERGNPS